MDCHTFENLLGDYREGRLTDPEAESCAAHLAVCASCRRLQRIVDGDLSLLDNETEDLVSSVLRRTTGSACSSAHQRLCDFVDGHLDGIDQEVVARHLEHCVSCSALAKTLAELREELPQMATLDPGEDFTSSVLELTTHASAEQRPGLMWRLGAWWEELIERPRFSLEAAYIGTLLLVMVFGSPAAVVSRNSARFAAVQGEARQAAEILWSGSRRMTSLIGEESLAARRRVVVTWKAMGHSAEHAGKVGADLAENMVGVAAETFRSAVKAIKLTEQSRQEGARPEKHHEDLF